MKKKTDWTDDWRLPTVIILCIVTILFLLIAPMSFASTYTFTNSALLGWLILILVIYLVSEIIYLLNGEISDMLDDMPPFMRFLWDNFLILFVSTFVAYYIVSWFVVIDYFKDFLKAVGSFFSIFGEIGSGIVWTFKAMIHGTLSIPGMAILIVLGIALVILIKYILYCVFMRRN